MTILEEIFAHKRAEVAQRKQVKPFSRMRSEAEEAPLPRDFLAALQEASHPSAPALIAEIKRASPSRGLLAADLDPLDLARLYHENGAAAISVLTDERYFRGSLEILSQIAQSPHRLSLLRKDFICDPYQIYESRAAGADAVLLIVAGLESDRLRHLHHLARQLDLTPLVEVHNLEELGIALTCEPLLVGVNNRDLRDFSVSLETTLRLKPYIPPGICLVAESGIHTPEDVACLASVGVDAILVGEALVTAPDVGAKVRNLAGKGDAG